MMRYKPQGITQNTTNKILNHTILMVAIGLLMVGCQKKPDDTDQNSHTADASTSSEQIATQTNTTEAIGVSTQRAAKIEQLAGVSQAQLIAFNPEEVKQGGDTGIKITSSESYSKPSSNISASRKGDFFIGNAFFKQPWVIAPASTDARDGLGALFNVAACQSCHIKDGRGHAPLNAEDDADSLLIRLSIPPTTDEQKQQLANSDIEKVPHPIYGGQLQDRGIQGVPAEAHIDVEWQDKPVKFADGFEMTLRQPIFNLTKMGYGDMEDDVMLSPRVALPMIGLGLLDQINADDIMSQADVDDADNDGISGKYNWVADVTTGKLALGRFGWKAGQPHLLNQNQAAFNGDMGLTSRLHPHENCTSSQTACNNATSGNDKQPDGLEVEVNDEVASFVEFYTRNLAVPNRRNADDALVLAGKKRFYELGCQSCHTPRYQLSTTDDDHLEQHGQVIYPYTDMLLHDMGDDLADRTIAGKIPAKDIQVEFLANSHEWRTPPLWGIGLAQTVDESATFLHDGRARTPMEAVLWHGGEAEEQKQKVLQLDHQGRDELAAFLDSL